MTPTIVGLVLASAVFHAWWNFLLKRHAGTEIFVGLSKLVEAAVFAPFFLLFAWPTMPRTLYALLLIAVATFGVVLNYIALTFAYRHGDLSLAYPVQRGGTLLFLPILAALTIGERVSISGVMGLAAILAGVLLLNLPAFSAAAVRELRRHLRHLAFLWALAVALNNAVFTLWDKYSLRTLTPFAYMYSYTILTALCYAAWVWRRHPRQAIAMEWRAKWLGITQVGVFNMTSYLLALFALKTGVSSYVIGFRQLSIAVGAILGWRLLRESFAPPRRAGVALIVAGCVLVAFAT